MSERRMKSNCRRAASLLRIGDSVMVMAGGNKKKNLLKSQVGKVLSFRGCDRVVVEGLNYRVSVIRPEGGNARSQLGRREASMHVSNVMYYAEELKRPVRLKSQVRADGTKVRGYSDPVSKEFVEVSVK